MAFWFTGIAIGVSTIATMEAQKANAEAQGKDAVRRGNLAQTEAFIDEEIGKVDAMAIEEAAASKAMKIKQQALTMRAGLVSAQAASGAVIGEGSAQAAVDVIDTLASADVLAALYSGADAATVSRFEGSMKGEAGKNAAKAGADTAAIYGSAAETAATWTAIGGLAQMGGAYAKYKGGLNTGGKA